MQCLFALSEDQRSRRCGEKHMSETVTGYIDHVIFRNEDNGYTVMVLKDTKKEERIRIVQEGLNQCGGACDFCNGCDNLGGGSVDTFYEPYINGEKELRQINEEYRANSGKVI